ncbi:MAG: sodium:solute symporter [Chlorobiota bacterium]|nr:MAG: sodium:solute symporter [Chlorobiota bacterium]
MAIVDYIIVAAYLLGILVIGMWFERRASKSIDSFFLGDRSLKWWALGASGMASNIDVSGTMINVALIYALGAQGYFIEIRGGIVLIMAFMMVFMGKWNRRAHVMTLAEWMVFRFGDSRQGKLARLVCAIAILMSTVAITGYFAVGSGKFIGEFLQLPEILGMKPDFVASVIMVAISLVYTAASGLYGVVWTDVVQGVLILISIFVVIYIAMTQYFLPETFVISTPAIDGGFIPQTVTRDAWTNIIPQWNLDFPSESKYAIYNLFGVSILFYLAKTVIEGSGGTGGYMIQRYYAARSDRDAGLLSLFWTVLLTFRWPFTAAIAIMAIVYGNSTGNIVQDPELALPTVIDKLIPVGFKGLLIAGLMSAAMSTFVSIVNAGASYWVNDIYRSFINKDASEKTLINQSRLASIMVVVGGLLLTLFITSINQIWGWLTMSMGAGLIVPLIIRWYWWRLNGYGFTAGVFVGMTVAIVQGLMFPNVPEYVSFLAVSLLSFAGTVVATLLTEPTERETLEKFFLRTRPFGFWGPVTASLKDEDRNAIKKENRRDIISALIAVPWQLLLFATAMLVVLRENEMLLYASVLLAILSFLLYKIWFKNLDTESEER